MGRPDQGSKAQTPVGYSHGTGVSTGVPGNGSIGSGCPGYTGGARSCLGAYDIVAGATVHALRAPWECYTGLRGQPAGPGSGDEVVMCAWRDVTARSSGGLYGGRT